MSGGPTYDSNVSAYEAKSSFHCKNMLGLLKSRWLCVALSSIHSNYRPCVSVSGALKVTEKHAVSDYCTELSKKSDGVSLWSPSARYQTVKHPVESTPTMIPLTPIARVSISFD